MAALALEPGCNNHAALVQLVRDTANGRRLDKRHVGEGDHPAAGIARCAHAAGEGVAHAMVGVGAGDNAKPGLAQHARELTRAGSHNRDTIGNRRNQVLRRSQGDGRAVGQKVQQLVGAKTRR